jgi:predicted ATPase
MINYKTKQNTLQRIALTGGPGVGKTTIFEILKLRGYQTIPEAARVVIEREQQISSDCLPWKNVNLFQNTVSELQFSLENSLTEGIIFSDRGIIDGHAYSKIDKIETPRLVLENARNRYSQVFLLDPLPIYEQTTTRWDDIERAKTIHQAIKDAYKEFGYQPIQVPFLHPEQRVDFILERIDGGQK